MPYEIFLALRHLRSRRNRRLARVTALIALTGISVGVAALIVAQALANGFRDEMRDKILHGTSHLTVMKSDGQTIANYKDLAARISPIDGVTSAAGTTYDGAVIVGPSDSSYAILRGLDVESGQLSSVQPTLIAGSTDSLLNQASERNRTEVLIGAELAKRARLAVGDEAGIMAVSSGTSSQQRVRVAGIVRTGLFEYDSTWVYLPLKTAEAFAGGRHTVSVISVQVKDIYEVRKVARRFARLWEVSTHSLIGRKQIDRCSRRLSWSGAWVS